MRTPYITNLSAFHRRTILLGLLSLQSCDSVDSDIESIASDEGEIDPLDANEIATLAKALEVTKGPYSRKATLTHNLSRAELSAILAGLRLTQKDMGPTVAAADIDDLCETINTTDPVRPTVTLRLTVDVTYEPGDDVAETMGVEQLALEAHPMLSQLPEFAASNGQLSGDNPDLYVKQWSHKVEQIAASD